MRVSSRAIAKVMLIEPAWQNPVTRAMSLCWDDLLNLKTNREIKYPRPKPKKIQTKGQDSLTVGRDQDREPCLPFGNRESRDEFTEDKTGHQEVSNDLAKLTDEFLLNDLVEGKLTLNLARMKPPRPVHTTRKAILREAQRTVEYDPRLIFNKIKRIFLFILLRREALLSSLAPHQAASHISSAHCH